MNKLKLTDSEMEWGLGFTKIITGWEEYTDTSGKTDLRPSLWIWERNGFKIPMDEFGGATFMSEEAPHTGFPTLKALNLSVRSTNILNAEDIQSVEMLLQLSREDILRMPNMGSVSVNEIEEKLKNIKLKLRT